MSYRVLARKWRPQKFNDVAGQGFIVRSLAQALKKNQIGHAYLFTGTRGVGKTTLARIFAKAIQCPHRVQEMDPCLVCHSCREIDLDKSFDVIEIDGASHNGVDDVRGIIDNLHYLPTQSHPGAKRIFIIDEVHMLTKEAFNALLKTLEEPPAHVLFMMATTDPEKIPETVLSRCQRFDLRALNTEEIQNYLENLLQVEGIRFEKQQYLTQVIRAGRGSLRDTLSLIEQMLSYADDQLITEDVLQRSLGVAEESLLSALLWFLLVGDVKNLNACYEKMLMQNIDLERLCLGLLEKVFDIIHSENLNFWKEISAESLLDLRYDPQEIFQEQALGEVTYPEIFWIYETLSKDFEWGLRSFLPEKTVQVILQKVTLRKSHFLNMTFASGQATDGEKTIARSEGPVALVGLQKVEKAEKVELAELEEVKIAEQMLESEEEIPPILEINAVLEAVPEMPLPPTPKEHPAPRPKVIKRWELFVEHLGMISPTLAANIEQGNVLQQPTTTGYDGPLRIDLYFKESGKIFLDYLKEQEVVKRLKKILSDFYALGEDEIQLAMNLVPVTELEKNFMSLAEKKRQRLEEVNKENMQKLLEHPFIRQAENLFSSKVDKVILREL